MTADELRQEMLDGHVSPSELAREVGVSTRAVRWWLSGGRSIPARDVTYALIRLTERRTAYRQGREDAARAAQTAIMKY